MAVVFVVLATLVVGAAVFGYVVYLTDGFDSELRNSALNCENKVEGQTASRRLNSLSLLRWRASR